jgi:hypothetical protein
LFDDLPHGGQLLFDRRDQFELGAATVEVVRGALDLKVGVAFEPVGQEAEADLEGDELL